MCSPGVELESLLETPGHKNDQEFMRIIGLFKQTGIASEEELADELLMPRANVNRWSRGRNLPHRAVREAICAALKERFDRMTQE